MAMQGPYGTLPDLANALRKAIEESAASGTPGGYSYELTLAPTATLRLLRPNIGPYADGGAQDIPDDFKVNWDGVDDARDRARTSCPVARVHDLVVIEDSNKRTIVQRAASRGIKEAVEAIDGYRYSFNNGWSAGMADGRSDGKRFSYICQDSMQNKDRHANGASRTQKNHRSEEKVGYVRKPTYDCKGSVCIKFSLSRGIVEVVYKHLAIHPTVAQRRANSLSIHLRQQVPAGNTLIQHAHPRPPQPKPLGEVLRSEQNARGGEPEVVPPMPRPPTASSIGVKRKRETGSGGWERPTGQGQMFSLAELLKRSDVAKAAPIVPPSKSIKEPLHPPPVHYDLPAWKQSTPRTLHTRPTQTKQSNGHYPAPYASPYAHTQLPHSSLQSKSRARAPIPTPAPAQSMFITLKQTPFNHWSPPPSYPQLDSLHPATSGCANCSRDERLCDGIQPVCGTCSRAARHDCSFDQSQASSSTFQNTQSSNMSSISSMGMDTQFERGPSPDPWFPKR